MASPGTSAAQIQKDYPTVDSFGKYLDKYFGSKKISGPHAPEGDTLSEQWANWYQQYSSDPQYAGHTLGQFEATFWAYIVQGGLGKIIQSTGKQIAKSTEAAGKAASTGLAGKVSPDWLNLMLRTGKIALGGVLLVIGITHMTGLSSKAPKLVKTAVKAAPFVM